MEYFQLGKTDLFVSPLCLGTSKYGTGLSKEFAFRQLDAFVERGGNFIDTAHVYGDWEPGESARSERVLGEWLRKNKGREKLVIATNGAHPRLETMSLSRCTPLDIETDLNESLSCLGVDCVDLYFLHRDDVALPVSHMLDCLEKARGEGKIRHYGCSNWTLPRIREADAYARQTGIEGFSCNQLMWSLAQTNVEKIPDKSMVAMDSETYEWHKKSAMSVTSYHSTAHGWFAKQHAGETVTDRCRDLYENDTNTAILSIVSRAAKQLSLSVTDISLGYMTAQPFSSVPITSFSSDSQLDAGMRACEVKLPRALVDELNAAKGLVLRHRPGPAGAFRWE
ncbi:MAG: aldo/keto reductase [Treponema sp.]|nr:aldo/keto reductase [Treponema sp.]